jgi:ABC-type sugar transport system permease subunit
MDSFSSSMVAPYSINFLPNSESQSVDILAPVTTVDRLGSPAAGLLSVGIAETWEWTPFVVSIVLAAPQAMPAEPVEAATVDGASRLQIFQFITLPYLWPTIGVCFLLRAIDSLKLFDLFYVLTGGGPGTSTEIIGLYTYRQGFNFFKLGYASALSYVILLVVVVTTPMMTSKITTQKTNCAVRANECIARGSENT